MWVIFHIGDCFEAKNNANMLSKGPWQTRALNTIPCQHLPPSQAFRGTLRSNRDSLGRPSHPGLDGAARLLQLAIQLLGEEDGRGRDERRHRGIATERTPGLLGEEDVRQLGLAIGA